MWHTDTGLWKCCFMLYFRFIQEIHAKSEAQGVWWGLRWPKN